MKKIKIVVLCVLNSLMKAHDKKIFETEFGYMRYIEFNQVFRECDCIDKVYSIKKAHKNKMALRQKLCGREF